jgi:hypothetical protein
MIKNLTCTCHNTVDSPEVVAEFGTLQNVTFVYCI